MSSRMDAPEQIRTFVEFFKHAHEAEILEKARKGIKFLVVSFSELAKFSPQLADTLLDEPEEVIKAAEIAVQELDAPKMHIRFRDLPPTQRIMIRNIRSNHLDTLLMTEGIVRQKSDVRPQVTSARFECPSCGNVISVLQLDKKFREPSQCGCGRKGKFRLLAKELVDAQRIVLEEAPELMEGGEQPKRMDIFLKADLVSPIWDKRTNPGTRIKINGIVKEVPVELRTGGQSIRYDLLIEANFVESVEEDFSDIQVSKEEEDEILEIARRDDVMDALTKSLAPTIYGHDKVKEGILMQLFGGTRKERDDGVNSRGDIHILLIGDPGGGKSQLLKRAQAVAPKSRYVTGKGATGAGLTAAVVKDEFIRGWALEAGALVLANKGFVMIDEMDKMSHEDRSAMHEALEQQSVSISKANIQATLRCETTVLAAANPKFGRFDPYEIISKQIDLPPTLINRFDLIYPIKDIPDAHNDEKLASFILGLHKDEEGRKGEIETDLLRKYIAFSRRHFRPFIAEDAIKEIKDYYVTMRSSGSEDGGIQTIPISARQLEALVRLTEAHAKMRLVKEATPDDAKKAIELIDYCLNQIGLDKETGKIDIDRISSGISASQRGKIHIVKDAIAQLEEDVGKTIPAQDIIDLCLDKGLKEDEVEETLQKLKRGGDLFEPRRGFYSRL